MRQPVMWNLPDFVGKYHLHQMTVENPVPGTAVRIDRERKRHADKQYRLHLKNLDDIEERRISRTKAKVRQANVFTRVKVQTTVGSRLNCGQRMCELATSSKKKNLSKKRRVVPDDEFGVFLRHVETNNILQVKSSLRISNFSHIDTAEYCHGNTPLHRAVTLGLVDMTRLLLEAGAQPNVGNLMGDAPIHCCWRFWKGDEEKFFLWNKSPYHMTSQQDLEDFDRMKRNVANTVLLLRLLVKYGADVDARCNNGEVALHTAAQMGPQEALWVLLLSKAIHNIEGHRRLTPELVAVKANKPEFVAILANWSIARVEYTHSEFQEEWMRFLVDPDANLGGNLTASQIVAQLHMEQHEERTAIHAHNGYTLVDEVITGLLKPVPERDRVDTTSSLSATESVKTASQAGPGLLVSPGEESPLKKARPEGIGEGDWNMQPNTQSKLGQELNVFLARARDISTGPLLSETVGEVNPVAKIAILEKLEQRRIHSKNNGENLNNKFKETKRMPKALDPFGQLISTSQRRRFTAREVAEDGGVESPLLRPATSSALLTTQARVCKKTEIPHYIYGQRLLTYGMLKKKEREAKLMPTARIFADKSMDGDITRGEGGRLSGGRSNTEGRGVYLNDMRMVSRVH
ncbi:unnamed protein product [Choristocarpus tenellus]